MKIERDTTVRLPRPIVEDIIFIKKLKPKA